MHRYLTSRTLAKSFLFATVFIPLIITQFTIFPFVYGKVLALYLLVEAALVSFLFYVIAHPAQALEEFKARKKVLYKPLLVLFTLYIGIMTVSTFFASQPIVAFWGLPVQNHGLFLHVHLFVLSVLMALLFEKKEWRLYVNGLLACTGVVVIAAWYQLATGRLGVGSFMGNSAYLGGFLLLVAASLHLFIEAESFKKAKKIYWGITIAILFTLLITGVRALLLGVAVGVVCTLMLAVFSSAHKRVRVALLIATASLAVFAGIFFETRTAAVWQKVPVLSRLAVLNSNSASWVERQSAWKAGVEAFKDRPLIGFGQNSGEEIFDAYGKTNTACYSDSWYFDLHSKFVEVMTSSGIFGLLFYFSLVGLVVFVQRKNLFFVLFFIAYAIQNLFLFDTPATYIVFAGIVGFSLNTEPFKETLRDAATIAHRSKSAFTAQVISVLAIALVLVAFVCGVGAPYMQQRSFGALLKVENGNELVSIVRRLVESSSAVNTPVRLVTNMRALGVLRDLRAAAHPIGRQLMVKLAESSATLAESTPHYLPAIEELTYSYLALGTESLVNAATVNGVQEDPQAYLFTAERFAWRMIKASPSMVKLKYPLIEVLVAKKKFDDALALAREVLAVDANSSRSQLYFALAVAKHAGRPTEEGKEELKKALRSAATPVCYANQNDHETITTLNFKLFSAEDFIVLFDLIHQYNLQADSQMQPLVKQAKAAAALYYSANRTLGRMLDTIK